MFKFTRTCKSEPCQIIVSRVTHTVHDIVITLYVHVHVSINEYKYTNTYVLNNSRNRYLALEVPEQLLVLLE